MFKRVAVETRLCGYVVVDLRCPWKPKGKAQTPSVMSSLSADRPCVPGNVEFGPRHQAKYPLPNAFFAPRRRVSPHV